MKILIVSEYIAPLQAIASVRWTKIAKYIKKAHPEAKITVLTNQMDFSEDGGQKRDELLAEDLWAFDEYWQVPKSSQLKTYEAIKRKKAKDVQNIEQELYASRKSGILSRVKQELLIAIRDLKERIFYHQAIKYLHDGKAMDFDVVISTYGPAWTHLVAEKIKKQNPRMIWIADFRDPYAKGTDTPLAFWRHRRFVRAHCAVADVITRVTDNLYLNEAPTMIVQTVTNGYDPEEALEPFAPNTFSIVFTGMLYGDLRDIGIACKAVKELSDGGKIKDARVVYAGTDGRIAKKLAQRYNADDYLDDMGMLPRSAALRLQQNAAILLQLNWNTAAIQCQWSGKMFEYMMMKKPIAFLVTGDMPYSYPSQHMKLLGGVCYEQCRHEETYPALKQYILNKYLEWKQTGNVTIQRDEEYVHQYSYENIAEKVWQLICPKEERSV